MYVVKNDASRDSYKVIAGEMLNREASLKHFVDGAPRETMPKDYVGYPSHEIEGRKYAIKACAGYIYIPIGVDISHFIKIITDAVESLQCDMVRLDGKDIKHLQDHQTHECGFNTNVRRSELTKQNASSVQKSAIRTIIPHTGKGSCARFVWKVTHARDIDLSVNSENIDDAISRLGSGIFWDGDDILVLSHGTVTFKFGENAFKANARVVPERITLINADNPLLIELNNYWKESLPSTIAVDFLRDINTKKLYAADTSIVEIKPVKISEDNATISNEICSRCKNPLYGDIYGLYGSVTKPEDAVEVNGKLRVTAICPMCLHSGPEDAPIEQKYFRVLRFKFQRTIDDMIDMLGGSDNLVNIRKESLKGVRKCNIQGLSEKEAKEGDEIACYLIGDEYVGFESVKNYKYTRLVNEPLIRDRIVCKIVMVA